MSYSALRTKLRWTRSVPLGLFLPCAFVSLALSRLTPDLDPVLAFWVNRIEHQISFVPDFRDPWGNECYGDYSCGPNRIFEPNGVGDDVLLSGEPPALALAWAILGRVLAPLTLSLALASHPWLGRRSPAWVESGKLVALAAVPAIYLSMAVARVPEGSLRWIPTLAPPRFALAASAVLGCFLTAFGLRLLVDRPGETSTSPEA